MTKTIALECCKKLEEDIVNGVLLPGQKLRVSMLKARFGVGQSPIREALQQLVRTGLVEVKPNCGFRVAKVSGEEVRDIFDTYFQIENLCLMLAIERGDAAWEAGVVAELHQLGLLENKRGGVEIHEWAERNGAFHEALASGCKSASLMELRENLYKRFDRYCRLAFRLNTEPLSYNHAEHKALAESALKRNKALTSELLRAHTLGSLENMVKSL